MVPVIEPEFINQILSMLLLAGATSAPYSTGIFETIVGVHFAGGLAVEFFDQPKSELNGGVSSSKKAIISFWFRAPHTALQAVGAQQYAEDVKRAAQGEANYVRPLLSGVYPLVMFGGTSDGHKAKTQVVGPPYTHTRSTAHWVDTSGYTTPVVVATITETGHSSEYVADKIVHNDPSYIGLKPRVNSLGELIDVGLAVHLQMDSIGNGSSLYFTGTGTISDSVALTSNIGPGATQDSAWDFGSSACRTDAVYPGGTLTTTSVLTDVSSTVLTILGNEAFDGVISKNVTPDRWHQVTISFDLNHRTVGKGSVYLETHPSCPVPYTPATVLVDQEVSAITDPCKLWIALDDVHYAHVDANDFGNAHNEIATANTHAAAAAALDLNLHTKSWGVTGQVEELIISGDMGLPTYTYAPNAVPMTPMGLPGLGAFPVSNHHVEMAEFTMWTGKSVDTNNVNVRRLFVDKDGKPVDPKVAIKALGVPNVEFHGSGKWIKGDNTGSGADFSPAGTIIKYLPDPSLTGKQGDPQ